MNKICLENEFNVTTLDRLNKSGYPECNAVPLTYDEICNLKIGTACYVATRQTTIKLMMFMGYFCNTEEFGFCCHQGMYYYKTRNVGKSYNVFKAIIAEN